MLLGLVKPDVGKRCRVALNCKHQHRAEADDRQEEHCSQLLTGRQRQSLDEVAAQQETAGASGYSDNT